jgi:YidC/Oxa1 family membrane protein insertase
MGKRHILALVLMVVLMLVWSLIFGNRMSKQRREQEIERQRTAEQNREATPESVNEEGQNTSTPVQTDEPPQRNIQSTPVHIKTNQYDITFAMESATATRWGLKGYPDRSGVEKGSDVQEGSDVEAKSDVKENPINLIPSSAQNWFSLRLFEPSFQEKFKKGEILWEKDKAGIDLTGSDAKEKDTITFSAKVGDSYEVFKKVTVYPNEYFVDIALTFENLSEEPLNILGKEADESTNGYQLRLGPGIHADLLPHERKKGHSAGRTGGAGARVYTELGKVTKEPKEEEVGVTATWAGLNNKYFAALMIPDPKLEAEYRFEELADNGEDVVDITHPKETASLVIPEFSLAAHQSRTDYFRVYVGPKLTAFLKAVEAPNAPEAQIGLSKIIDFGYMGLIDPIAWAMLWLLNGMYAILPNYGLAIIVLTALIKIISYPLMRKSYKSMNKMKELQPLLAELKEKHRDDPQKLNRATMRLYKEQGVNPLGGCIPWLPQMPIFFALFALLGTAVELRGAPFLLWMDDLSAPDVLVTLPFTIPLIITEIDAIRILPIINGLTQFLQQKFVGGMAPATDNTQAKIMQFLPLIFVFLFYNWASGFVLYWLCNNVFTVAQQYLTQNRDSDETETPKTSKKSNPLKIRRKA